MIRNIDDDSGISFQSTTRPAILGSSMTSFALADPSVILTPFGTVLQIHERDNCLFVNGTELLQDNTCTQRFALYSPLGGEWWCVSMYSGTSTMWET